MELKMKHKILIFFSIILMGILLSSCGESAVDVSEAKYEPKIVIDAYIYPMSPVNNIKLTRNFPLNTNIDITQAVLDKAGVTITDLQTGSVYRLEYDPQNLTYYYSRGDLVIGYGKSYRLDVSAEIDGKKLTASSTTTVPQKGLDVQNRFLGSMKYREKDAAGNVKNFIINFKPSEGCSFYGIAITPRDPSVRSFIFDNAFFKPDTEDVIKDFTQYSRQYRWIQNVNSAAPVVDYKIEWFDTWFYDTYVVKIYAGDRNFFDFLSTHNMVQEPDGNFHEPRMHIEGDGIGVFASAVVDSVLFSVNR